LPSKSNTFAILQVDERLFAVLRVRRSAKGLDVLEHAVERGHWSTGDGSLQQALAAFVQRHQLARTACYYVLPRHEVTSRILVLPSHDAAELGGMVRLCAEEYTPYRAEELVTGECILQKLNTGESSVLAIFAQQTIVDAHLTLLAGAGVRPESVFFSTACLASAAIAARPSSHGPYALVNLASGGIEVLVLNGARIEHARGVAAPHNWEQCADPASEAFQELAVEVRASLSAHRREAEENAGAEEIFLASDCIDVEPVCVSLERELGQTCRKAEFALRTVSDGADKLVAVPMSALGAAITAQNRAALVVILESESLRAQRKRDVARQYFLLAGGLVGAICAGLIALYALASHQRNDYLAELDAQIEAIRPEAHDLIEKQRQLGVIEKQVDRSSSVLEAIGVIHDVAPVGRVNIKRLQFDRDKGMTLEGRAVSDSAPYDLAELLRDAAKERFAGFSQARVTKTEQGQEQNLPVWNYTIEMPFPERSADESAIDTTGEESPAP
jgi:hypothetical protein